MRRLQVPPRPWPALWPEAAILAAVGFAFHSTLAGSAHIPYDAEFFHYPLLRAVQEQFAAGRLPTWEAFSYGGSPLLANAQSAWLYPPHLLLDGALAVLGKPLTEHTLDVVAVAHVAVAGLGTVAVARGRRLGGAAAAFAGVFVVLNGAVISQAEHVGMTETLAWLPWAILALDRIAERGISGRRIVALGACAALMITAGFLPLMLACAVLLLGAAVTYGPKRVEALKGLVAGMGLGAAFSAAMLLPIVALLGVFPPLEAHAALPAGPLVTTLFPNALGHWQASLAQYAGPPGAPTNSYYFLGAAVLVLLPLALTSARRVLFELALVVVALLASFGAPAAEISGTLQSLPTIGPLWRPEDIVYVATVPVALLLARGLRRAPSIWQLLAVALTLVLFSAVGFSSGHGHDLHLLHDAPRRSLIGLALVAVAVSGAAALQAWGRSARGVAILLALAAVVAGAELASAVPGRYFVNSPGEATSAGTSATGDGSTVLQTLQRSLTAEVRVAADVAYLPPPWAGFDAVWRLPDVNGFQPQFSKFQLARVQATGANFEGRNRTFPVVPRVSNYLKELDVRYIVVTSAHDDFAGVPGYKRIYDNAYRVYRLEGEVTRAYAVSPECLRRRGALDLLICKAPLAVHTSVARSTTTRLRFDRPTPASSLVVTGEPWYPGWHAQASSGSLAVKRVGYLAAVSVPRGVSEVKLSYSAPGLIPGIVLSALAIVFALLALLRGRRRSPAMAGA